MESGFISSFVLECEKIFDDNLVCILLIGSVRGLEETPFSDIDLIAVIKTFDMDQMKAVRKLLSETEQLLDLSFLCQDELPDKPEDFCLGTHGCYHMELVLKNATCLWGENIFQKYRSPTAEALRASVFSKIAEYCWWNRRMFVESNRERSMGNNYKLNSRLIKMIKDVLFILGLNKIEASAEDVVSTLIETNPGLLSVEEERVLFEMPDPKLVNKNVANMGEHYLEIRFSIMNKLYKCAINAMN